MSKKRSWGVGIVLFLAIAGLLWYQVFSSTDIARVGEEQQSETKIERPKPPPVFLPNLPNIEEKNSSQPTFPQEEKRSLSETDHYILRNTLCICGCKQTLAECRCPVALEEMRKMGILLERESVP